MNYYLRRFWFYVRVLVGEAEMHVGAADAPHPVVFVTGGGTFAPNHYEG